MLNRQFLSRGQQTAPEVAEVAGSGSLLQTRATATGNARSPKIGCRVRLTMNEEKELERSSWRALTSAT